MNITHSIDSVADRRYFLHVNRERVAELTKVKGGFIVTLILGNLCYDCETRTMKATKEFVWGQLPPDLLLPKPAKAKLPTVKEAAKFCDWSHTAIWLNVREAKRVWPEMATENMGAYFMRRHVLTLLTSSFSYTKIHHGWCRRWLAANPTLGWYDEAEERRRLVALYGEDSLESSSVAFA